VHSLLLIANDSAPLRERLRIEGYEVVSGDRRPEVVAHDCLIVDLSTTGQHGFDLCRELRAAGNDVPIIFLTRGDRPMDGVIGLRLGGDDYLRQPLDVEELLARLEAVLRRSATRTLAPPFIHSSHGIRVNFRTAEVARAGRPVCLSALELHLLRYLIEHRGEVLSREELLEKVWGYGALPVTRTVDVRIASLRRKLEADPARPELIRTVHGVGYKFDGAPLTVTRVTKRLRRGDALPRPPADNRRSPSTPVETAYSAGGLSGPGRR
jgi:DNA-binding response OmpR family regulator